MATSRSAVAFAIVLLVTASGVAAGVGPAAVSGPGGGYAASPPNGAGSGSNGNGPDGSGPPGHVDSEDGDDGDDGSADDESTTGSNGADAENGAPAGSGTDGTNEGEADAESDEGGGPPADRGNAANGGNPGNRPPSADDESADEGGERDDDRPGRGPPADRGNASERTNATPANAPTPGRGPPAWANAAGSANATVSNPTADAPVRVNVSGARTTEVGVDALTVTTRTNESYDLSVTTSDRSPADAPDFDASPAARDGSTARVGHVRVDHSVSDANISRVDFDFTVNASRLAAVDASPENVALYRFHDGGWAELNTTLVGEVGEGNRTVYAFVAHSPGLSDFVIGAKRAKFELANALVSTDRVRVGDSVTTRVRIRNTGGADGTFTVNLLVNDAVVDGRTVTVAAEGTRQASFDRPFAEAGTYAVRVNDLRAGEVHVLAAGNATRSASPTPVGTPTTASPATAGTTATTAPGFGPATAVGSLLAAGVATAVRRRRG